MPNVVRVGDPDTGGGIVTSGASTVFANGMPVALPGMPVTGHGDGAHAGPVTVGGSGTVKADGQPVIYVGCADSCGHSRATGSPDVQVGA